MIFFVACVCQDDDDDGTGGAAAAPAARPIVFGFVPVPEVPQPPTPKKRRAEDHGLTPKKRRAFQVGDLVEYDERQYKVKKVHPKMITIEEVEGGGQTTVTKRKVTKWQ